jgi:nitrogen regulatory protein PII
MDNNKKEHELIIAIVDRGFSGVVMDAARAKGARGGTILHGHGTGKEARQFFNITLDGEKEAVLIVVDREARTTIMDGILRADRFLSDAQGIIFTLPIDEFVILRKLHEQTKKEAPAKSPQPIDK